MNSTTVCKEPSPGGRSPSQLKRPIEVGRDSSGIALFMVLASVSVLAVLVGEFTYISEVGQMIAYGALDQTKAHYTAKSGLKLSLLRLKAYQQIKKIAASMGGAGGASPIPNNLINMVWSFPIIYPLPTNLPGMSIADKDMIEKFQKESNIDGQFTATIESESSKYNLNSIIPGFSIPDSSPSSNPSPGTSASVGTNTGPSPIPSVIPSVTSQAAQASLQTYLQNILNQKSETDADFATLYRDFRLDDFMDQLVSWADRNHERKTSPSLDKMMMKRAPFYSISELHMLPAMDDDLYDLFAPNLSTSTAGSINVNTLQAGTLHALTPEMTNDELNEFFKFRDSSDQDNSFKSTDDFYKYLQSGVAVFKNQSNFDAFKKRLADGGVTLTTEETQFKITVQAKVNTAIRTIEAWVTLGTPSATFPGIAPSGTPQTPQNPNGVANGGSAPNGSPPGDSGLKITYMRIL